MLKKILVLLSFFAQLNSFAHQEKDSSKIVSITIGKDGILNWTTNNDQNKTPFDIEEYRWNKWIKIGEVEAINSSETLSYTFNSIQNSGENQIRVLHKNEPTVFRSVKWTSELPVVKFTVNKDVKAIQFTAETLFEIWDTNGNVIKRGLSSYIDYKDIPAGSYILNFDNSIAKIKL
jgi:hypothetical protein